MDESVKKTIGRASSEPGVYIFKDAKARILYVGKADRLRERLKSYVNPADPKTERLVADATTLSTIVTSSGVEALILEDALVKQNQPRYNVRLRDDKRYPYIRVSVGDPYPRISVVRRVATDGARYFGPYVDARDIRRVINLVGEFFGICKCKRDHKKMKRPCLNHSLGICAGPGSMIGEKDYDALVSRACDFLAGDYGRVKRSLVSTMKDHSRKREYERALRIRESISAIESLAERQHISGAMLPDMDALGWASHAGRANVCQLKVRGHKVVAVLHHPLRGEYALDPAMSMKAFIKQHYTMADLIPAIMATSAEPEDRMLLEEALSGIRGKKVAIRFASRGAKRRLTEMAVKNSLHQLEQEELIRLGKDPLHELAKELRLPGPPKRIEGYDISNLGDKATVGSMVVFTDGVPDKSQYRMFGVRGEGQDDPGNMAEVVGRRFRHDEWRTPDLVVLDGGKPQLSACRKLIPRGVPVISLAKKEEEIFRVGSKRPLALPKDGPPMLLLRGIRDEAHRFGKRFHTIKRGKQFIRGM